MRPQRAPYRSVVMLGRARLVAERREKLRALKHITDHVVPDRWSEVREPNELEMKQTIVLCLPLKEVSAKVRTGPAVTLSAVATLGLLACTHENTDRKVNPVVGAWFVNDSGACLARA
jgi:nitroimidazol reductase NimA-like FMN-containing flavoprotein (pyridoxamine 5'-phosphate oxidase superfamily)